MSMKNVNIKSMVIPSSSKVEELNMSNSYTWFGTLNSVDKLALRKTDN